MFIKAIFPGSKDAGTYTSHQFRVLYQMACDASKNQANKNIAMVKKLISNMTVDDISFKADGSALIRHCPVYSFSDNGDDKIIEDTLCISFAAPAQMEEYMRNPKEAKTGLLLAVKNAWLNHANILYKNIDEPSPKIKIIEVFASPEEEPLIRDLENETGIQLLHRDED